MKFNSHWFICIYTKILLSYSLCYCQCHVMFTTQYKSTYRAAWLRRCKLQCEQMATQHVSRSVAVVEVCVSLIAAVFESQYTNFKFCTTNIVCTVYDIKFKPM